MEQTPKQGGGYCSPWAIKKVVKRFAESQSTEFSNCLLEEADVLRSLEHPNIIGYRTLKEATDSTWCLVNIADNNSFRVCKLIKNLYCYFTGNGEGRELPFESYSTETLQ